MTRRSPLQALWRTPSRGRRGHRTNHAFNLEGGLLCGEQGAVHHEARDPSPQKLPYLRCGIQRMSGIDVTSPLQVRADRQELTIPITQGESPLAQLAVGAVVDAAVCRLEDAVFAGHGTGSSADHKAAGHGCDAREGANLLQGKLGREPEALSSRLLQGDQAGLVVDGDARSNLGQCPTLHRKDELAHIAYRTGTVLLHQGVQASVIDFAADLVHPGHHRSAGRPCKTRRSDLPKDVRGRIEASRTRSHSRRRSRSRHHSRSRTRSRPRCTPAPRRAHW